AQESYDATGIFGRRLWLQDSVALLLNRGHEPCPFAKQFRGDVVDADFENQFHGGCQPDQPQQIIAAGFVAMRAGAKCDALLRHVVWTAHIVPTQYRRLENLVKFLTHVKDSCGAWAE